MATVPTVKTHMVYAKHMLSVWSGTCICVGRSASSGKQRPAYLRSITGRKNSLITAMTWGVGTLCFTLPGLNPGLTSGLLKMHTFSVCCLFFYLVTKECSILGEQLLVPTALQRVCRISCLHAHLPQTVYCGQLIPDTSKWFWYFWNCEMDNKSNFEHIYHFT